MQSKKNLKAIVISYCYTVPYWVKGKLAVQELWKATDLIQQ